MESKKKKQAISLKVDPMHVTPFDFDETDFIAFFTMQVISCDASTMESERLHLFEPSQCAYKYVKLVM